MNDIFDESLTKQWQQGILSNYDYLIELNKLVGRYIDNKSKDKHPILPWVVDFTNEDISLSLRDLKQTKYRLTKGDQQ